MTPSEIYVGQRVRVFDASRFVNDFVTPKSVTMREATVLRIRFVDGRDWLADVAFPERGSRGHFISGLEPVG